MLGFVLLMISYIMVTAPKRDNLAVLNIVSTSCIGLHGDLTETGLCEVCGEIVE